MESPPIAECMQASCLPAKQLKSSDIKNKSIHKKQKCLLAHQAISGIRERYRADRGGLMEKQDQRKRKAKTFVGHDFCESSSKTSEKDRCLWKWHRTEPGAIVRLTT